MTDLSVDVELLMETANVLNRTGRDLVSCCNLDCRSIINELDRIALKYRDYSSVTNIVRDIKADINEILKSSRQLEERNQDLVAGLNNAARAYRAGEIAAKAVVSQDKVNIAGKIRNRIGDNMITPSGNVSITELDIKSEEEAKKYVADLEQNAQEIEMYITILNNYRASGQGEPQWVLDKLEALGAPYSIIDKNATLSYEQAKNAAYIADALLKEQYQPTLMETLEAIIRQQSPENLIENRIAELTGMGKQILYEVITNDPVISPIVNIKEYINEFSFTISDWDAYVKREDEEFRKTVAFLIRNFTIGPRGIELTLEGELYYGQIIQAICTEIYNDPKKFNELVGRGGTIAIESILMGQVFKTNSVTNSLDNIDDVNNLKKVSSSLNVELIDEVIDQGDLISVKLKDGKQFLYNKVDIPADELKKIEELKLLKNGVNVIDDAPRIKEIEIEFNYKTKYDEGEFARQLADQEAGMNNLTVDDYLRNRERYLAEGRSIEGNLAQKMAREEALVDKTNSLMEEGLTLSEAKIEAKKWLDAQDALHNPDQVAGGNPMNIGGVGDSKINSSIGVQWKYRINTVDEYIKTIAATMTEAERESTYLNIKLRY